jgi:hypothetical protein
VYILPTSFGNVMRAFEGYSRVRYGIDAIPALYRMNGVISPDFTKSLATAKAILDNCVNVLFLSLIFCLAVAGRIWFEFDHMRPQFHWKEFIHANWWEPVCILVALAITAISYRSAKYAALGWGNYIKAAFDLYTGAFARALGHEPPLSIENWRAISRSFIYHDPLRLR